MGGTRLIALTMGLAGAILIVSCTRAPAESTVTIEGNVVTVSTGEATMTLERPEQGFSIVVLAPGSSLLHADGTAADLAEHIATGSAIRASGRPGRAPDTLLAEQVVILGEE